MKKAFISFKLWVSVGPFSICVQTSILLQYYLSQVQQRSGVWYSCHAGVSGAAGEDAAADAGSDDHRQPSDGRSADPAGGGMYTQLPAFMSFYM